MTAIQSAGPDRTQQLTGEDRVRADSKYRYPREFYPTAKHIYSANELPDQFNADDAFWRRVLIVPFPDVVPRETETAT